MPVARNRASMNVGEAIGRNLLQPHHRAGLVERPARAEHPLHQRRLGAGEDVADLALVLHRGAQRVLDAAAVERADRLELVERDRHAPPLAASAMLPGQREHLLREPRDVAVAADGGERRPRAGRGPAASGSTRTSGRTRAEHVAQPGRAPRRARVSTASERPGVALEKRDVGAVAADRDLDRQRARCGRRCRSAWRTSDDLP